jgi:acyl transferase domain-containing protein
MPRGSGRIAIIGMSGRYPQAGNLAQFWSNLAEGRNSITEVPPSRWDVAKFYDPDPRKEGSIYCKWIGMLDDIEAFDPLFFRISPAEAKNMDPQHRMFLEEGYRAFEHAGYARQSLSNSKCGVYVGIIGIEYSSLVSHSVDITGTNPAIGAARIAYFLNLKGPAIAIDTACSASLVAMHLACQGLASHETDMALAGGVSIYLHPDTYMGMCKAGMLSPDGQCRTFDDRANGFVPGEGVGAVVLKRLEDAERDGDVIHGVIVASGINQDGKTNGITAPSVNSQIELERGLYAANGIHPESISYVETHGTGTKLGDPIELEALSTVFREQTQKQHFCALGSVKSNIGHASGAAGVASVHKVLLCMRHRTLVPSLNVTKENTLFDLGDSPFYVSKTTQPWRSPDGVPRRAAVSSFGFSGTNAHLVIEEYLPRKTAAPAKTAGPLPFVLSARTPDQLRRRARDLLDFIAIEGRNGAIDPASMACTLLEGREALDERFAVVARSVDEVASALKVFLDGDAGDGSWCVGKVLRDEDGLPRTSTAARPLGHSADGVAELARAWVRGEPLTWAMLNLGGMAPRMALPTYPFATKRYWVDPPTVAPAAAAPVTPPQPPVSAPASGDDGAAQRVDLAAFVSLRAGDTGPVPAAAYLEIARTALIAAAGDAGKPVLDGLVWGMPLSPSAQREVLVTLFRQGGEHWAFEIHSRGRADHGGVDEQVHCQGQAHFAPGRPLPHIDLAALRARTAVVARADDESRIDTVLRGDRELLVQLRPQAGGTATLARTDRIDAVLRSAAWLTRPEAAALRDCAMPDALASCHDGVERPASAWQWAWVRVAPESTMPTGATVVDIDVCDDGGNVVLRLAGVTHDRLALAPTAMHAPRVTPSPVAPAPVPSPDGGRPRIALAEMQ